MPNRGDDVRLKGFGIEIEASGRIVILTIIALAALGITCWGVWKNELAHEQLVRGLEVQTCVLTLNEAERREFRAEGKYCPTPRVRFRDDSVTRDERQRFSSR